MVPDAPGSARSHGRIGYGTTVQSGHFRIADRLVDAVCPDRVLPFDESVLGTLRFILLLGLATPPQVEGRTICTTLFVGWSRM